MSKLKALLAATLATFPTSSSAQSVTAPSLPALLPGEVLTETANGCYVITERRVLAARRHLDSNFGTGTWSGECPSGLASGRGSFGTERKFGTAILTATIFYEMKNGRYMNTAHLWNEWQKDMATLLDIGGQAIEFKLAGDPYLPDWEIYESQWLGGENGVAVRTIRRDCQTGIAELPGNDEFTRSCSQGYGTATARGVQVLDGANPQSVQTSWCGIEVRPRRKCEEMWKTLAGPVIASVKSFRERHATLVAQIEQQSAPLAAAWAAQWPAVQLARQQARAAAATQAADAARSAIQALRKAGDAQAEADRKAEEAGAAEDQRRIAAERSLPAPRFRSVCMRNFEKMGKAMANNVTAAATYDLWQVNVAEDGLRILQPCEASDPDVAYLANRAREQIQKIRTYCAGPHHRTECQPWGYGGVIADGRATQPLAQAYTRLWHDEAMKAVSDPNYSADLGRAGGPRPRSNSNTAMNEACRKEMHQLGDRMHAQDKALPADDIVHRSELILWYTLEAQAAIARTCPSSPIYQRESQEYKVTHDNVLKTCNQVSTTTCTPKQPGA